MSQVLLLNASGEPLRVISLQRALSLIFGQKVDYVEAVEGRKLRSPSLTLEFPSILRLRRYVNVPRRSAVYSRRAVFARDNYTCQYCGKKLSREDSTLDHIIPIQKCKELGVKASTFGNSCCSCQRCNLRKSSKTMRDAGMKFFFEDFEPKTPRTGYIVMSGDIPSGWKIYLET